jgi:hypothetical protein
MTYHPPFWLIDQPADLQEKLDGAEWGTIAHGKHAEPDQVICPLCMTVMPARFTEGGEGSSPRHLHTSWHVALAGVLHGLQARAAAPATSYPTVPPGAGELAP